MAASARKEVRDLLRSCKGGGMRAGELIDRLGLVTENGIKAKPKFAGASKGKFTYVVTQQTVDFLASTYSRDQLNAALTQPELMGDFIEEVSTPFVSTHGTRIWGAHGGGTEQNPGKLDINNENDKYRIKGYLCGWIVTRAFQKMKRQNAERRRAEMPGDLAEASGGSNYNGSNSMHRSVLDGTSRGRHGFTQPDLASNGLPTAPQVSSNVTRTEASPSAYRAPTALMQVESGSLTRGTTATTGAREPLGSISPSTSSNITFSRNGGHSVGLVTDDTSLDSEPIGEYVDDVARDPDYIPGVFTSRGRKRRRNATARRAGKLPKPRKNSGKLRADTREPQASYSGPPSPLHTRDSLQGQNEGISGLDDIRFTPLINENESEIAEPISTPNFQCSFTISHDASHNSPNVQLSPPDVSNANPSGLDEPESVVQVSDQIQYGSDSGGNYGQNHRVTFDETAATEAQLDCQKTELRSLLLSHLEPRNQKPTDYVRLVELLDTIWQAQEANLRERFGTSYPSCKVSFEKWIAILRRINEFQLRSKYFGHSSDHWAAHCRALPVGDRMRAVKEKADMQLWMKRIRSQSYTVDILESLRHDLAVVLLELAELHDWLSVEELIDPIIAYNRTLLAWFT